MQYIEAMDIIGSLSTPSKMPWYGFSTSAFDCQTGSKLRQIEGSVCSKCYACKGQYSFPNVRVAQDKRMEGTKHPDFVEAMVLVLTTLYNRGKKTYIKNGQPVKENRFRWHDAGDIQSLEHLEKINEIALKTPFIDYWLPTKEVGYVNQFLKKHKMFADNLTVRISNPVIGETFKKAPMGLPFSTVNVKDDISQCLAPQQENKCLDCRMCWDKDKNVNYKAH